MADNTTGTDRATEASSTRAFVADGVRLGYQVIDAYLQQGQRIARQFVTTPSAGSATNGDTDERDIRSMQFLTEVMANWSDLLGTYTEALNTTSGAARSQGLAPDHPAAAPVSRSDASLVRLAFQITSRRPALVDAEFFPGRETVDLAAHNLRCLGASAPEIGVAFEPDGDRGRTIVSIEVPDGQPAGLYTGALLDSRDGTTVGSVSLRVR